jgi:hypothetical protein
MMRPRLFAASSVEVSFFGPFRHFDLSARSSAKFGGRCFRACLFGSESALLMSCCTVPSHHLYCFFVGPVFGLCSEDKEVEAQDGTVDGFFDDYRKSWYLLAHASPET